MISRNFAIWLCCVFSAMFIHFSVSGQISGSSDIPSVSPATAVVVDATITVGGSVNLTNATVQITSNFYTGDVLSFNSTLATSYGITGAYTTMSGVTGLLQFTGTTTPANWQAIFRTVTYQNTSAACGPSTRNIVFMQGTYLYNGYNGHYYEYVSTTLNWTNAKAAAANRSFNGMQGYLATATSAGENNFIWKLMASNAWVGATYDVAEINAATGTTTYATQSAANGNVYWVTGPEKGTQISSGIGSPVAQNGQYMNWNAGEPNNYNNTSEYYVQLYSSNLGLWNDLPISSTLAYLVEYGGMPNDAPQNNTFSKSITLNSSVGGVINGGDVSVCAGTNSTTLTTTAAVSGVSILRWESSLDNFITAGTPIAHTGSSYTVTNLSQTTYFRSIANGNSCSSAPSSSTKITVGSSVAGTITAANNSICSGSAASLTLTGNIGNIIKWQSSPNNSTWTDISNTTALYTTPALSTGTYYYRAHVQNSGCAAIAITPSLTITVTSGSGSVAGNITGIQGVCNSVNSGTLTLSGHTGTVQKWQYSTDNGILWTNIANTTNTYTFTNITSTTKYRAEVKNGSCNSVNTTPLTVIHYSSVNTWLGTTNNDFGNAGNWSCAVPASGANITISSGAPVMPLLDQNRIVGNLTFEANTNVNINGYTFTVNGSVAGPSTGTFKGSANSSLVLGGNGNIGTAYFNQDVPGTSNLFKNLTVNLPSSGEVTLGNNINIGETTTLTAGIIKTGSNTFIINDNATVSGVSNNSYINGNVRKTGNDAFTFPVGDAGYYAPASISAPSLVTDHFTASYTKANPITAYNNTSYENDISQLSTTEYWLINRTGGSSNVTVTLSWNSARSTAVTALDKLRVSRWNGSTWTNASNTARTGTISAGTVTSNTITSFSPFTLALSSNAILPVTFLNFTVKNVNGTAQLNWQTTEELNNSHFDIERSADGISWTKIGQVAGNGTGNNVYSYSFTDNSPGNGKNFYRLKQIDIDGQFKYSVARMIQLSSVPELSVYPNPFENNITVDAGSALIGKIIIVDNNGRAVHAGTYNKSKETIRVRSLPPGQYTLLHNEKNYKLIRK